MSGAFVFWLTGKTGQPKVPIPVAADIVSDLVLITQLLKNDALRRG